RAPASFAAKRAIDRQLRPPALGHLTMSLVDARTANVRELDEPSAPVALPNLAADPSELLERCEHPADGGATNPEQAAQRALRDAAALALFDGVQHVETRGGEPHFGEDHAADAKDAVVGALQTEEDRMHAAALEHRPCRRAIEKRKPRTPPGGRAPSSPTACS